MLARRMRNAEVIGVKPAAAACLARVFVREFFRAKSWYRLRTRDGCVFICDRHGAEQLCFNKILNTWSVCGELWSQKDCVPSRVLHAIAYEIFRRDEKKNWEEAVVKAGYAMDRAYRHRHSEAVLLRQTA